ncbi:chromosome partitioning protein ParA (plasmid) [Priestia filamentosa]|uniref:Chromosome partitioning protein ParA n=1 Tax=Priestia filamentosa TaxID=1402861 RepID=A0A2S1M0H0_9BACI|nr:ParA family protein [Priestia filamentosa]AWG44848.1 chromosome partitioning protein ParA [Priestia filamentosa]
MSVICINNNKGGVLKTTTTTNLAGVLASKGEKILIVDADNQSNVSLSFGLVPDDFRTSLYDVLTGGVPAEDCIASIHTNIDLLPSNRELISFEFDVIGDIQSYPEPFYLMKDNLEHLRKKYDYILIDTPPSLGLMNGNVFTFSDYVLIPYAPELFSMRSLIEVVNTINDFKELHNPDLEILGVLRTIVNSITNLHNDVIQETNKYADQHQINVFETVIPDTVQFSNAVAYHRLPATLIPKKKNFDKAELYFQLWEEIQNKLKGVAVK